MGLLDDYANLEDVEATSFEVPNDAYEFIVSDVEIQEGSTNHPDWTWFVIKYILTNDKGRDYNYREQFRLPEDPSHPTELERTFLSMLKSRLLALGLTDEQANDPDADDIVGIEGTLNLVETKSRKNGNTYQNIRNMRVTETVAPAPKTAPKRSRAVGPSEDAAPAKATTARRARRSKAPVTVEEAVEEVATSDEEPVEEELSDTPAVLDDAADEAQAEPETDENDVLAKIRARRAQKAAVTRTNPFSGA